ncbi:hypothetical protein [Coleofasciculus sp. FACHB-1120]|uniref:hypothetical protein n=1 Tax=Coleofasciculus sp. FACHB-1120 TaxID=2692783 RepID=UPI001685C06F|nr:hypothetical protein [Coleofasciculus sp. FACHB-1120]MBD2744993.1 hypothetical protein [Coleofasciculus sp. FACHB-1120]
MHLFKRTVRSRVGNFPQPVTEHLFLEVGEDPSQVLKLTRLVGLLQDKPPETEPDWEEVIGAIENVCGEKTQL